MLDNLLDRWHGTAVYRSYAQREPNERTIIALVVALVFCSLLYLLLWQPLSSWSTSAAEAHEREQSLNDWLLVNEDEARKRKGSRPQQRGEGLLTIVSRTAENAQLKLTRFQPESNGVSVVLQKQSFNGVLGWIDVLEKQEQVLVVQASVDADSLSGRVNARFSLRQ